MLVYKAVNSNLRSALIEGWRSRQYKVGKKVVFLFTTPGLAFDTIEHARCFFTNNSTFNGEPVLLYKAEAKLGKEFIGHTLDDNSHLSYQEKFGWPAGTVFCKSITLIELVQ